MDLVQVQRAAQAGLGLLPLSQQYHERMILDLVLYQADRRYPAIRSGEPLIDIVASRAVEVLSLDRNA